MRRNGVPEIDLVTTNERFTRPGYMLTNDPVYLTEPLVRSRNFVRMSGLGEGNWIAATPCEPGEETAAPPHTVPHYLPGENPFVAEAERKSGIPAEALTGGAETLYPEYRRKLAELRKRRP